jgi:hypothetical protein
MGLGQRCEHLDGDPDRSAGVQRRLAHQLPSVRPGTYSITRTASVVGIPDVDDGDQIGMAQARRDQGLTSEVLEIPGWAKKSGAVP